MGCEVVGESQDSVHKTQLTEERGEPKQIGTWVHLFTNQVPCYEAKWSCTIGSEVSEHGSQAISQKRSCFQVHHHHHHHISLKCEGRLGTTGDFATSFLYFPLFSTALLDLVNSRPVHSLVLSSPPLSLSALSSSSFRCAVQDGCGETWWTGRWETQSYHCSLRIFTLVKRSSRGPIACWILARTSLLVTWSLYVMHSILQ